MDTVHENIGNPDYTPSLYQAPDPLPDRRGLGIHVLVGKVRLPQPSNASCEDVPQFRSMWAFVRVESGTLSYDAFHAAVLSSATALISQQHDQDAVTVFHPIGKYISYHATSPRADVNPGEFVAPTTSLMTFPSTRSHDERRPVWIDFHIHSAPAATTFYTSELNEMLKRLDTKLGDGPDGKNTLRLGEIPGSAPDAGTYLTVSRQDWACAIEMSLLLLELNGPSKKVQTVATYCGRSPSIMLESYEALLRYLAEKLYFNFLGGVDLDTEVRRIARRDYICRPQWVEPGFLMLMEKFVSDRTVETVYRASAVPVQDLARARVLMAQVLARETPRERELMAQDAARHDWFPGFQQFPRPGSPD